MSGVMECLNINPYVLEKEFGIKNAQAKISHYKKGVTKAISCDILIPFCEAFPQVNANYILTGKDSMFLDDKQEEINEMQPSQSKKYDDIIKDKDKEIEDLKNEIKALTRDIDRLTGENSIMREQIGIGERLPQKSA